jgi:hypothetical protein
MSNNPEQDGPIERENNNEELIAGLRGLAEFLEQRPEFPILGSHTWYIFQHNPIGLSDCIKSLGRVTKYADGGYIGAQRRFGPIVLDVSSKRSEVCRRVVKGTRTVTKLVPVQFELQEVEEEIVEWECPKQLITADHAVEA